MTTVCLCPSWCREAEARPNHNGESDWSEWVMDNYAAHKHPNVQTWLARNPRITLHFTPTSGSWLNLVEIFFGIIEGQAPSAADPSPRSAT